MNPSASELWLLLESGPGDPAYNMAMDEVLLAEATRIGHPLLRFYSWTQPAATFGYAQHWDQVAALTSLRPLIRRPTGGGVVLHDGEWTYSVVLPQGHEWTRLRARDSYHRVHDWVRESLTRLGIEARLAPPSPPALPGACFARAEESDVLAGSAKIAGAAQRRNRQGLLIQGSVRPPGTADRPRFESAMRGVATERWGSVWQILTDPAPLHRRATALAAGKFACASHNQRR